MVGVSLWVILSLSVKEKRSPEYNGNVERRHGTIKYEFFSVYDGPMNLYDIRAKLKLFI